MVDEVKKITKGSIV